MLYTYVIADLDPDIPMFDAIKYIGEFADVLDIKRELTAYNDFNFKMKPFKTADFTYNRFRNDHYADTIHVRDTSNFMKRHCTMPKIVEFIEEQQKNITRLQRISGKNRNMIRDKTPVTEMSDDEFEDLIFYLTNRAMLDSDIVSSVILNRYFNDMNTVVQQIFYEKIQEKQIRTDYEIYPDIQRMPVFSCDYDIQKKKIGIQIMCLKDDDNDKSLLEYENLICKLIRDYPMSTAYLDKNKFCSFVRTPHEHFLNIQDNFIDMRYDQPGLMLRGYTRNMWLNKNQITALGGRESFRSFNCREIGGSVHVKINEGIKNYKSLKRIVQPLLIHGSTRLYDSQIFSYGTLFDTVIEKGEWHVEREPAEINMNIPASLRMSESDTILVRTNYSSDYPE